MEALHSLEWGDMKISKISNIKNQLTTLRISVALLTRLSGLQTVTNELNLLFGFSNDIGSKHLAFSGFRPIERGTTLAFVQSFKGSHLQT
jgi:hypothetical protein